MTRQRLTLWLATLFLFVAGACVSSGSTRGNARIVVMPISGSKAVNGTVADVVDSRYELVSSRRYAKAARKLDAKSSKSKDVRKVSRKLEIDAMVAGEFVKRGKKKYELRLTLRAGDSGKKFNSIRIKLKSKKLSRRDRNKIKNKLYIALSEVDSWTKDVDESARSRSTRGKRVSSSTSHRERERARKIRESKHDRDRRDEERRADRDAKRRDRDAEKRSKEERKRAEKKERKRAAEEERKIAKRERKQREREEEDDERSRKSKKDKKKEKKKDESYEVITVRDTAGQAVDDESPF